MVLPFLLFALFFHIEILDPTNISWIMAEHGPGANDWGQHALGWHAYRHDVWRWPFNEQKLLAHPTGLSVLYTDSNPLIAIPLKLFGPLLPETFQYIGVWFLACVILQVVFAWKLVRPYAGGPWSALAGVATLSALPAFWYRIRHDNLMPHWLILWALHAYFNVRDERRKLWHWAGCLTLSAMIHPYILFMVLAIWAAELIRLLGPHLRHPKSEIVLPILRNQVLVFLGPVLGLAYGGAFSGQSAGAVGYGVYSMGLDAPINPVLPQFSFFLKANAQDPGQAFEGFQYLGFGLIVLLIAAVVLRYGFRITHSEVAEPTPQTPLRPQTVFERLKYLTIPLIILMVVTVSNRIQLYDQLLLKIWLPPEMLDALSIVRASGRLFWPVSYGLVFMAIIVIYQTRLRTQALILSGVLALQAIDLQDFAPFIRAQTKEATLPHNFIKTRSPQWEALIGASTQVDVYPPRPQMDEPLFYEIAWRAVQKRIPVSTMYAARPNPVQIALEYDQRRRFLNGETHPDHLSVFLTKCDAPPALRDKLQSLDGVLFIPPRKAENLTFDPPKPQLAYATDELHFGWRDPGTCLLGPDWAMSDQDGGSWTDGDRARLDLPLKNISAAKPYYLNLWVTSFHKPRKVRLYANDRLIAEKTIPRKLTHYAFDIPHTLLTGKSLRLRFDVDDPMSPKEAKRGKEPYRYGIKLYMMKLANVRAKVAPEIAGS